MDSFASNGSQVLDPDDPTVTGERKNTLDDPEDVERACLKQMNYKARRKLQQRVRIEFNITCESIVHICFQRPPDNVRSCHQPPEVLDASRQGADDVRRTLTSYRVPASLCGADS